MEYEKILEKNQIEKEVSFQEAIGSQNAAQGYDRSAQADSCTSEYWSSKADTEKKVDLLRDKISNCKPSIRKTKRSCPIFGF